MTRATSSCAFLSIAAVLVALFSSLATIARAQPSPTYPATGLLHDPSFIPVAIVGSGFGNAGPDADLVVIDPSGTITINSETSCPDPPATDAACIIVWRDGGIMAQIGPDMVRARLKIETPSGDSEPIRVHYYGYDSFGPDDEQGFPNSAGIDDRGRVWVAQESDGRDLLMLDPSTKQLVEISLPCSSGPTYSPLIGTAPTACPNGMQGMTMDPYGRVWFPQHGGKGSNYNDGPDHDRIVMYDPDPSDGTNIRVYPVPPNGRTIDGVAYEVNYDGLGNDRVWYTADKRTKGAEAVRFARVGWFDPEVTPRENDPVDGTSFDFPVDPVTEGCETMCPDHSGRTCTSDPDCAPLCVAGLCLDGVTACTADTDCGGCRWTGPGFFEGVCRDGTGRACAVGFPDQCLPICGLGTCKASGDACFNDHDCALGLGGARACLFDDLAPDCYFHEYDMPPGLTNLSHIAVDHSVERPPGYVWAMPYVYLNNDSIVSLDPSSPTVTGYALSPDDPIVSGFGPQPWDVKIAPNGDVIFDEYFEGSVNRFDVSMLDDPGVDCTTLQGSAPNRFNPCIQSVAPFIKDIHQILTIDLDSLQNVWFAQKSQLCSDPTLVNSVGYVKWDFSEYVILPTPTRFSYPHAAGGAHCPAEPHQRNFSAEAIVVDPVTRDVWAGGLWRQGISRFSPVSINLALGKGATQSATWCWWGDCEAAVASNAVDGHIDGAFASGSVALASLDPNDQSWWQVDLGALSWLEEVELWPRTDLCCDDDLANFRVFVSDVPFASDDPDTIEGQAGVLTIHEPGVAGRPWSSAVGRTARYVRVQLPQGTTVPVQLAEVVALGAPLCANDPNCNLALGKTATQSATWCWWGDCEIAVAPNAVDGSIDGHFSNRSTTIAIASGGESWWEVDLGDAYDLDDIEIWNRTDPCCSSVNADFRVFVSDVPFVSNDPVAIENQAGVLTIYEPGVAGRRWTASLDRTGRYVRVQRSGGAGLQLAEVVVSGKKVPVP